tara:strand:- start:373 stop:654 length:282 start_codon:yes stop_codon:yes gene_type:complete
MNKRTARQKATEGGITIGGLRAMILKARDRGGMSRVNPAFTLDQTLDIYERAIEGRADDEEPRTLRPDPYSRSGRMKPTGDVLLITNILRDAA